MSWQAEILTELAARSPGGYEAAGPLASEPTALAALALAGAGRFAAAARCADWLQELQHRDGSLGVMAGQPAPQWPTSLAILAWHQLDRAADASDYSKPIACATKWALDSRGTTTERKQQIGHDTALVGWSWAADTHSWLEPTAFFVLALKAVGQGEHPRTREAMRLLFDRLLPNGGCNYGNTIVLGQPLLPHIQPTGIAMWALGGEEVQDHRIGLSLDYLEQQLSERTATASLCYGLLGLSANCRRPREAESWLEAAYRREQQRGPSCYKLALIALAATPRVARITNDELLTTGR
ncbi:MAG: hypothetical protein WD851_25315 [Pirellulales bacterium]